MYGQVLASCRSSYSRALSILNLRIDQSLQTLKANNGKGAGLYLMPALRLHEIRIYYC